MSLVADRDEKQEAEILPESHDEKPPLSDWENQCAQVGVGIGIFMSFLHVIFTLHWNQGVVDGQFRTARIVVSIVPGLVGAMLLFSWRSRPLFQLYAAFLVVPVLLALYSAEVYGSRAAAAPGTAALRAGRSWDSRNAYEVIQDLRREGKDAFPLVTPTIVYKLKPNGFSSDGSELLPLGAISNRWTTLGNETGRFVVYHSDEHGFNNPNGAWRVRQLDLAVIGSSFAQGGYVSPEKNLVAYLRKRYADTLNLGMCANGPLLDLAGIREYLPALRPRLVVWLFPDSDISNLPREATVPVLMRYLQPGFRQGLLERQEQIDRMLIQLVPEIKQRGEHWPELWPTWLTSVGLTRRGAPLWIQDLVMGEDASTQIRVMRLEQLRNTVMYGWIYPVKAPARGDLMSSILQEAQRTVASWGGKLYFVYVPSYEILKGEGRETKSLRVSLLSLAQSIGITTIDLYPKFQLQPNPLTLFAYPNSHYNEDGYRLAAEGILESLPPKYDVSNQ